MATAILFKNADLYAPEHKGIKQLRFCVFQ